MNSVSQRGIVLQGGDLAGMGRVDLRLSGKHIAAIGGPAQPGDLIVELQGERVLPGLINAHDHLQLNNFPRIKFRAAHGNVAEWIADVAARRAADARLWAPETVARDQRLWHGGLKNLLAGVTTVVHHDPYYPALAAADFPLRVLADYGWAHSLAVDGEAAVQRSHRSTRSDRPWFIHAGEGVDAQARGEFAQLEQLGCVGANARLIHGVAFGAAEQARLAAAGAGLIWCPASNLYLLGRTADVAALVAAGRVALGSDSRLSGADDLLAELREAHATGLVPEGSLESLVTTASANLLGLQDRGVLRVGALADILIVPRGRPLWQVARRDVRAVLLGGAWACGDVDYATQLRAEDGVRIQVDGCEKVLAPRIANILRGSPIVEAGLIWVDRTGRAA